MTTRTFEVPNINCGHCTHTIEMELGEIEGVRTVSADVETRQVSVEWVDPASWDRISNVLVEIDFPPAG